MSDVWTRWEGHVIDGTFPLLRCLGASDHSGVFLTEPRSGEVSKAALKLVPVIPSLVDAQLAHWRVAAELSHPRLVQLYDTGRCQLGEQHFLFLVMEYAEQNLAEVLPHRALTVDEAREMLLAALDPLAFLHGQQRVQGQLKPSNILVVGDQLKLASDTIRPASEATANISMPSSYDAPEGEREIFSTASDVWALGVTLAEALTQQSPSWTDSRRTSLVLPQDFPATFADVVRRCLSPDPKARPGVAALISWARDPGTPLPEPAAVSERRAPSERVVADRSGTPRVSIPVAAEPAVADRAAGTERAHMTERTAAPGGTDRAGVAERTAVRAGAESARVTERTAVRAGAESARVTERAAGSSVGAVAGRPGATAPRAGTPPDQAAARTPTMTAERRPAATPAPPPFSLPEPTAERRSYLMLILGAVAVAVAIWAAVHVFSPHSQATIAADTAAQSVPAAAVGDNAEQSAGQGGESGAREVQATPGSTPPSERAQTSRSASNSKAGSAQISAAVVHEEIPRVPKSARDTIHGRIKVTVRVTVDRSGTVVNETLDTPGPSHYFARLATQAARKWKFAPTEDRTPRERLVHFEFSREATTGHASAPRSR
jgi:TonB family protein